MQAHAGMCNRPTDSRRPAPPVRSLRSRQRLRSPLRLPAAPSPDGSCRESTPTRRREMLEAFLLVGLLVALPVVYFRGKKAGFERHHCVRIAAFQDRAPQTFVTVPCPACGLPVDCALDVKRSFAGGVPTVGASV